MFLLKKKKRQNLNYLDDSLGNNHVETDRFVPMSTKHRATFLLILLVVLIIFLVVINVYIYIDYLSTN